MFGSNFVFQVIKVIEMTNNLICPIWCQKTTPEPILKPIFEISKVDILYVNLFVPTD